MASYGISDKYCGNINIKLILQSEHQYVEKGLDIQLNGYKEKVNADDDETRQRSIKIEGDVKKKLAETPVKYLLRDLQKYLSIRYDEERGCLMMNYDGTDVEKLPELKQDQLIYQHKNEDVTVNGER